MNGKRGPIIFLITLTIILVFILGIRYGQRVEKTNKAINYILSLPPTKPPEPTQKPMEFKEYTYKDCGIKFLYPSFLSPSITSTDGATSAAVFMQKNTSSINIDCEENNLFTAAFNNKKKSNTAELVFKNKKLLAALGSNTFLFEIVHNYTGKIIHVVIDKNLYLLFEKSLEFVK